MGTINVAKPKKSDASKVNFATECAFSKLVDQAKAEGLPVAPVDGLMYLPDQAATSQFQDACRAVLKSLGVATDNDG